ncbi:MAG: phenylacetate--CoA ligase family protein [Candidatus Bathyarchaeota archaeon]|nr:MAG: phenylacetate--CoA ligase family protein [Candidatus Bathyarchaeota archaeon]
MSRLEGIQRKKLQTTVEHAYRNVPFYHRKFRDAGVTPSDIQSVADLSKLPLTTKLEVQSTTPTNFVSKKSNPRTGIRRRTSGSTGRPLTITVDPKAIDFETAMWVRTFRANGLKVKDRMAFIADPRSFPRTRWLRRTRVVSRRYISIFDKASTQLAFLRRYRPNAIKAYPSSLRILADAYSQREPEISPRMVFTSAELLDNEAKRLISSAFETEVYDNYACSEFGLLGWECHQHEGYHLNVESVAIEFVKHGEAVAPGESGEVVCTSLENTTMPLIRYRLEDVGVPLEEPCSCGITLPLIKVVEGRVDDFLTATDGKIIPPTVFFPYPFENMDGVKQFRVIQEKKDKLTFQLVENGNRVDDAQILAKAKRKIQDLFGDDMEIEFQIKKRLDRNSSGKLRKIISHVPVHFG